MTQTLKQRRALKSRAYHALEWLCWAAASGVVLAVIVVMFLITFLESPL